MRAGFVEAPLRETTPPKWKELSIDTGAAQSTLEDIKLSERAGGYVYHEDLNSGNITRNRFIYWKTNNNVLELIEESLDVNLIGNRLRLRFQHTPLLEGVSIFETQSCVVVLAATVASVHRISFPHPRRLKPDTGSRHHSASSGPSVFFDASAALTRDYHVLNHVGLGTTLSQNSCSWLGPNGEAIFVLGTTSSALFVVSIDPVEAGGKVSSMEIRKNASVARFLSGMLPSSMRGEGDEASISLVCHYADDDLFIFALSRELRIRQWSYRRQDLLMMMSVLDYCDSPVSRSTSNLSGRQSCMYKATDSKDSGLYLGVYVSFAEQNSFFVFRPAQFHGSYKMTLVTLVKAPENDLVDFCLTSSRLWTLWVKQNDEPVVCMKEYGCAQTSENAWVGVCLQSGIPPEKVTVPTTLDPRELYLEKIFGHSTFSYATMSKALGMYSRRGDSTASFNFGCRSLREEVVAAVEAEIHAAASDEELGDVEYVSLALKCWGKFFYTCTEYHEVGSKPLGLLVDSHSGLAALIRRDHVSMLRPCEWQESCILSEDVVVHPFGAQLSNDILVLVNFIKEINACLAADMLLEFAQGLYNMESPVKIARRVAAQLLTQEMRSRLERFLQTAPDLLPSLQYLIQSMDFPKESQGIRNREGVQLSSWNLLFASMTGRDLISTCVQQMMQFRFIFCQNLLLLECLLLFMDNGEWTAQQEYCTIVSSEFVPRTEALVQAYYLCLWASETEGNPVSSVLEGGISQMSLSNRSDGFGVLSQNMQQANLVWLFLGDSGGELVRRKLSEEYLLEGCDVWSRLLSAYLSAVAQLLWPFTEEYAFAKTLLDLGQHLQLQEYVRLLGDWCPQNKGTRKFLLATSLLGCNEPHKACTLFQELACGTFLEEAYLQQQIGKPAQEVAEVGTNQSDLVIYFLKVIHAFEQSAHPECAVAIAKLALDNVDKNDPSVQILWSLLFSCQLMLGHIEDAYAAMIQNPDSNRRETCLRQLVVVLCERRELSVLVTFPFKDVEDDVVAILEARARATELIGQFYYDVLYSMHVSKRRHRRAAAVMYEHAARLAQEVPGVESLRKQKLCLLASINCLLLAKPEYAWIARPVVTQSSPAPSPKHDRNNDEVSHKPKGKVQVITVEDIRHELTLCRAWLLLTESGHEEVIAPLSPEETATLLVANGHFDVAAQICESYQLMMDLVFEGLVEQYARGVVIHWGAREALRAVDPQWIVENPRAVLDIPGQAWFLLQHYLLRYESEPGMTRYHRLVASALMAQGCSLPPWFLESYKKKDAAELLRLLIRYGRLEEATDLSFEYIEAVLGQGTEYFGLPNALHAKLPPVWLPHTTFDCLLVQLQSTSDRENYNKLSTKMREYMQALEHVTRLIH